MFKFRVRKSLLFALAMIGFTATSGQIIVVREFMVVFYGNELCLGLILANWLLWGALGSWVPGRLADRMKRRTGVLASCEIFLAFALPAIIFAARSVRIPFKALPTEIMGVVPISIFTFVVLAPLCGVLGFLFALGARMYPGAKGAKQIGHVYILESVGASAGGLLTSLLLIRYLNSLQIAMIIGALNLAAAASLRLFLGHKRAVKFLFRGMIAALLMFNIYLLIPILEENVPEGRLSAAIAPLKANNLHRRSLTIQWGELGWKASRNSIYSNLVVIGDESSRTFYSNSLKMFTIPPPEKGNPAALFPMLEHPDPRRVLIIGGGIGGSLGDVIKHPVEKVDYVELDPEVIKLVREYPIGDILDTLSNPKVEVINMDGRAFVKQVARERAEKYDVIIVNLPEPSTAQLNRFYTKEFFQELHSILTEQGVFSVRISSSVKNIRGERQRFLNCVYITLDEVFSDIMIIPVDEWDSVFFISCKAKETLTYDSEVLLGRIFDRQLEDLYIVSIAGYYIYIVFRNNMAKKTQIDMPAALIRELQDTRVNRDFRPVSYYYNMMLWAKQSAIGSELESAYGDIFGFFIFPNLRRYIIPIVGPKLALVFGVLFEFPIRPDLWWFTILAMGSKLESAYRTLFEFAIHLNLWWFVMPAFVAGAILFCTGFWMQSIRRIYILVAVMVTGFAEIAFEVVVSLAFQIIYGYMYYKLGIILTAFMIGLIAGGITITRIMDRLKNDIRAFMLTQVAVCIYPLILLGAFLALRGGRIPFLGANIIFPALPVIAGFIGGFQFPLATKIYLKHKKRVGRVAGLTYGVDLIGSCAGAFFVSAFLVPIIGIPNTCFAVVLLSVVALILLVQSFFRG